MWIAGVLTPHHEIILPDPRGYLSTSSSSGFFTLDPLKKILWLSGLAQDFMEATNPLA